MNSWTDTEDLSFHMLVADTVQREKFKLLLLRYLEEFYKNPLVGTGKPTVFFCSLRCFSSDRAFCYVSAVIGLPAFPQNSWYFVLSVILNIYSVQPNSISFCLKLVFVSVTQAWTFLTTYITTYCGASFHCCCYLQILRANHLIWPLKCFRLNYSNPTDEHNLSKISTRLEQTKI